MDKNDLTILKQYHDRWVAVEKDGEYRIVGVADTASEALQQAQKIGVKEPMLTKVPREYGTYIL